VVYLIELFKKYLDWKILAKFIENPNTKYYVKELSRVLEVSPGSVSSAVKRFEADGLLIKSVVGQTHQYIINIENPGVLPLKKFYGLVKIHNSDLANMLLGADENIISLAIYGSYADGTYDEKSDLDVLIITPSKKEAFNEPGTKLQSRMGLELSISIFKLSQWRKLAKQNDPFYKRIVENHTLFYGSGIE
jgi:predicted nucleotidyltransferase